MTDASSRLGAAEPSASDPSRALRQRLEEALRAGDLSSSEALARLLLAEGTTYEDLCDGVLRVVVRGSRVRATTPSAARRALMTTGALVSRLRRPLSTSERGRVVFAVTPGDGAFLEAYLLASALELRGWATTQLGGVCAEDVLELAGSARPDVLVVPLAARERAPVRTLLRAARSALPGTAVVGLATCADEEDAGDLTLDGVTTSTREGVQLVGQVAANLSERDLAVLAHVARGRTNKEIARALDVTPTTVKSHLDRIFTTLGTPDRAAAAALAVRRGWIT